MIRFLVAVAQMIAQFIASGVGAGIAFLDWLAGRLSGGSSAPAAPIPNLEMALPDPDRIVQAKEMQKSENAAVDMLAKQVLTPAQQAQAFAMMPFTDRGLADISKLTDEQVDWLYGLHEEQLVIVKEASERRVADALAGKPKALMATLSVGEVPEPEKTFLAHRIEIKRAAERLAAPLITYEAVRI
ncbi:hypothetical protein [Rhizobium ruizarguesonis]|uniref:hypothetical protein n=1 Tax=Rhizobium ruizarguesonis TaxID=2081791 RepID=UPI0010312659|nr:hypothetical protein [Rhizobium ruizarguesonis]TAV14713.1 hypothetical protein ELI34_04185 [Rhizobium ruizarguesonis]